VDVLRLLTITALGAVELWAAIPAGLALKANPVVVGVAAAVWAMLGVLVVVVLGEHLLARPYGHAEGFATDFCCFMAGPSMGEESTPACRKPTLGEKCSRGILFSHPQVGDDKMEKTLNLSSSRPWGGEAGRAHSGSGGRSFVIPAIDRQ